MLRSFDIALVCGRRPDLLEQMLSSFQERVFKHFDFANVFANIDPFAGTAEDGAAARQLILERFPEATIFEPNEASFVCAVQRLWTATRSELVLHLEDDWLIHGDVTPELVEKHCIGNVKRLSFTNHAKIRKSIQQSRWRIRTGIRRRLGLKKKKVMFRTSPSFWDGIFLRECAELLKPGLDPEAQFYTGINSDLQEYAMSFQNKKLSVNDKLVTIEDIGRDWRKERGIKKIDNKGSVTWTSEEPGVDP